MKKLQIVLAAIMGLTLLAPMGAGAYTINDTTLVQKFAGTTGNTSYGWMDVIGDGNVFQTSSADWANNTLTFYTNWNPTKNGQVSSLVTTADLFVDLDNSGTWDVAVRLDSTDSGKIYSATDRKTSFDVFNNKALYYGRYYDSSNNPVITGTHTPMLVPVLATGDSSETTSVTWTYGASNLNNTVAIDLSELGLSGTWSFLWATGTCANDTMYATVTTLHPTPVPASVLLLGTGLVGLVGLKWRRREKASA